MSESNRLAPIAACACFWMLFALLARPAFSQVPTAGPTCMTLLTADELTKAVGIAMTDMGGRQRAEGETECPWMLRGGPGGFKTVAVQFYDLAAIKARPVAPTLDAAYEEIVSAAEGMAAGKREALSGIGQKAHFVPTDPQVLAVVQRAEGVTCGALVDWRGPANPGMQRTRYARR